MLKTNSKKAVENIRQYIIDGFNPEYIDKELQNIDLSINNFKQIASLIYADFKRAKGYEFKRYRFTPYQQIFEDWAAGLPGIIDTCYYYNRSAVKDLQNILEETDAEASKYTEEQAEKRLTYLIYREITKAIDYNF